MSYHHFYKKLDQLARKSFPSLSEVGEIAWDHLISPLEVRLPTSVLRSAQEAISAFHALSRRESYVQKLPPIEALGPGGSKHESVLMAYDFHTNEAGECFLVEVNTNASGYMMASLMQMTHADQTDIVQFDPLHDLRRSFEREAQRAGVGVNQVLSVAITDEEIQQQKMLPEFLMYRDWFQSFGWNAEFCEASQFIFSDGRVTSSSGRPIDLIYNRLTDFYLENPIHAQLAQGFVSETVCLTPNPREYWLLADKERLIQMTEPGFLEAAGATETECAALRRVLIPTFELRALGSHNEIWQQRRELFFKPKRSHGGKSVYRGESVSRKVFERLMNEDILIQRFTPAQKMPIDDPRSVLNNWKFDLRFFVYEDRIQLCAARIYQGQVTNFASPLGGFTMVRF